METTTFDFGKIIQDMIWTVFNTIANYDGDYAQYKPLLVTAAVLYGVFFIVKVVRRIIPVRKDSRRLYSDRDKLIGFARAGKRCEMEGFLWFRCSRKAEHGDHHYPHSRGGATSMKNFVAACAKCNISKGAKVPSRFATKRMERRRRGYFPSGVEVTVGERITRKSGSSVNA